MTSVELLDRYNYYRLHTGAFQKSKMRTLKPTPDRLAVLDHMSTWCAKHELDPHLWLYSLFLARHWLFAPPFNQMIPSKKVMKKALSRYHALRAVPLFTKRVNQEVQQVRAQQGREHVWDPNRDLSNASESVKRRYLLEGQFQRCIAETMTRTYGYHPRSLVCARCPVAHDCMVRLQASVRFDIMALRRGVTPATTMTGHQYEHPQTAV
jgi:hypothetical protein